MRIIVDAMGGDNGCFEIVKGFLEASNEFDVSITFVGLESEIKKNLSICSGKVGKIDIVHAKEEITNLDDPIASIRQKKDSSIVKGLNMLKDCEGDVFLSAGNTGAIVVASTLIIKRINKVRRVAISPLIPCKNGRFLLIDAGANNECTPEFLTQFATMGSIYVKHLFEKQEPTVALVNIGVEDNKGSSLTIETHKRLKESGLNYKGNIEARDIFLGEIDVVVTDGFTGNIILKLMEGESRFIYSLLKGVFTKNIWTKMGYLFLKKEFSDFKKRIDYVEYNGSPILGLQKPVIKVHGNSNAKAFFHAAKQAINFAKSGIISEIKQSGGKFDEEN